MNWQTLVSLLIVAVAAAALLWGVMRRRKLRFDRSNPCGCALPARGETGSSVVFHARKGERPKIIVKNK